MKDSKNIIIALLILIIVILITLTILFATNTIIVNNTTTKNDNMQSSVQEDNKEEASKNLTNDEAITIVKTNYNEAIRHIFNQAVSYCGEYSKEDDSTLSLNGFSFRKSATYSSFEELENDLKNYITDELLSNSGYNKTITIEGNSVSSYYEKDGSLYCNSWNKGSNLALEYYSEAESTFTITNIESDSFTATINAVYYDTNKEQKTTKEINVSVINQNNKWLFNTYDELATD